MSSGESRLSGNSDKELTLGLMTGLVVLAFGMGYFLSYFLRNVNAVLAPTITFEFSLSASEIGLLTSLYFLAAALVLVPVAMALDRFGPRRVMLMQMVVTATGCILFATGNTVILLMVGRVLIGLGVAGCLTTAFKAVTVWFPSHLWATGNSMMLGVGSLGVIAGTQPLVWILDYLHWRDVFWLAAIICALVFAVLALFLPERNAVKNTSPVTSASIYRDVLTMKLFWRLMPAASFTMAFFFAVQGLWANSWMSDVAELSQSDIGLRLLVMALAMSAGMMINGTLGDWLGRLGVPLMLVMAVGIAAFMLAMLFLALMLNPLAWWPWVVIGYTGSIGALGYPLITRQFPMYASARVISVLALSNFILAFILQFALGFMLDLYGRDATGAYPVNAYQSAFLCLLFLQLVAFIWLISGKESWVRTKASI